LVRASFLSLREREFAEAARAVGNNDARIIFRHLLPNAVAPIIVQATLDVAGVIILESTLSFLGLGHPAADGFLGQYARQRPERSPDRLVGRGLSPACASW
jgi:ABC-type dipeptide/oligopeptide/nickel transport system permease subunit